MERTLVILKPDTLQRGLVGEVISRFEKVGLKIIGIKMVRPDKDHYFYHYETISKLASRANQKVLDVTLDSMMVGPVVAIVLEGVEAVTQVRKMVGATEPKTALPGTIRGDYSHLSINHANAHGVGVANIIHASGNAEEASQEVAHWFNGDELFDYEVAHEKFTQPRKK